MTSPDEERQIAIALMDALAFKGIHRQGGAAGASRALRQVRRLLRMMAKWSHGAHLHSGHLKGTAVVQPTWFSDTLLIAVKPPPKRKGRLQPDHDYPGCLVDIAALCASYVIRKAAQLETPLLFRGVVTVGKGVAHRDGI